MIQNFIVSALKELWIDEIDHKFILEPHIYYELKKRDELKLYKSLEVAQYRRKNKNDLISDSEYIDSKFEKYIPIITSRLNSIHKTNFNEDFWKKSLSVHFERYIVFVYEIYSNCKTYYNPEIHKVQTLAINSIDIPKGFDEQRELFHNSHYGIELIFSLFIKHFNFLSFKDIYIKNININKLTKPKKKSFIGRLLDISISKLTNKILCKILSKAEHEIGILGSHISKKSLNELMIKSQGKIFPFDYIYKNNKSANKKWEEERDYLSKSEEDFDNFDNFFFSTMKNLFPTMLLEQFQDILSYYQNFYEKNKSLKYIFSEVWPSVNFVSIGIAFLKTKGVKHVYNEHNYFAHPFECNELKKSIKVVDIFFSLGWFDYDYTNMIQGGSLFEFTIKKQKVKYDICYITGPKSIYKPQFTPTYGIDCEHTLRYYKFVNEFFSNLSDKVINSIYLREYPIIQRSRIHYDDSFMLKPYYSKFKKINSMYESGKQSISKSKLVIIDYISTPYLESILINTPTIFFHNTDCYYLSDKYKDFFKDLIECGICQTDPKIAANFVEEININPEKWWFSEQVQSARKNFIDTNIGKPDVLKNYALNLLDYN